MAKQLMTAAELKAAVAEGVAQGQKIRKIHTGRGVYLWLTPDGKAYWRYRYQVMVEVEGKSKAKEQIVSLGVYPAVSLKEAQAKRDTLTGKADPAAERRQQKEEKQADTLHTFRSVAEEWYVKRSGPWSASYKDDIRRRLEQYLYPHIGDKPVAALEASDIINTLEKLEAKGAVSTAHRTAGTVAAIFRFAVTKRYCRLNVAAGCAEALATPEAGHQPAVKLAELPELVAAIDTYDRFGDRRTMLALKLLLLTAVRASELLKAEWEEFDLDAAMWVVPESRMKMGRGAHMVPLAPQAVAILRELQDIAGESKWVLPGRSWDKPVNISTLRAALYRLSFKGRQSSHGMRALFSTIANEHWQNPRGIEVGDVVEVQLAHLAGNKVRRAYNKALYLADRTRLMTWWADYIDAAREEGKAKSEEISQAA